LFIAWCDRRRYTANNSMIDVYRRFWTIAANGTVTPAEHDFRITTESFPPAFPGTLSENTQNGYYDPVWPPGLVPLDWWYGSANTDPPGWWPVEFGDPSLTDVYYAHEHGEHNGVYASEKHVYLVWSDHRGASMGSQYNPNRRQSDIRMARISWP
jgi:hypothetical protein